MKAFRDSCGCTGLMSERAPLGVAFGIRCDVALSWYRSRDGWRVQVWRFVAQNIRAVIA